MGAVTIVDSLRSVIVSSSISKHLDRLLLITVFRMALRHSGSEPYQSIRIPRVEERSMYDPSIRSSAPSQVMGTFVNDSAVLRKDITDVVPESTS